MPGKRFLSAGPLKGRLAAPVRLKRLVRKAADVPELHEHDGSFCFDRFRYVLPSSDLIRVVNPRRTRTASALKRDLRGLANDQPASRCTLIVPGTQAATTVMPRLTQELASLREQRGEVASEVELLVHAHTAFASAAHLAAYAGVSPVTRRSSSSIRGEHPSGRWQQGAQESAIPVALRCPARSDLAGLLRSQGPAGQAPPSGAHCSCQTAVRRPVRHAA